MKNQAKVLTMSESKTMTVKARVEWFDEGEAIVRFDHPRFGAAERPFTIKDLPEKIEQGDSFSLGIEMDAQGEVVAYHPNKDEPVEKRVIGEWEKIPRPEPPQNIDNPEEMKRYNDEMLIYSRKVSELRRTAIEKKSEGKAAQ